MPDLPDEGPLGDGQETPTDHDVTVVSTARQIEASSRRLATLVVVRGAEIGRHYPLRRTRVVLGRGDAADVVIPHREISRAHAQIEAVRWGRETIYRLSDLGSTNAVFVNGERVQRHVLGPGDKIQLGDAVLKFELLDAIDEKFHTEIRHRIQYDDLTGLLTYESFRTALEWELERFATTAKGCSVVMMDLDDFKRVNDTYGHPAGSAVLREVGDRLRENVRQFDVAARYGGEEFVAYLPETDPAEALTAAERLRRVIADEAFVYRDDIIRLTISIGLAHFPEEGRTLDLLIDGADRRLYRAKRDGKNRVYGAG